MGLVTNSAHSRVFIRLLAEHPRGGLAAWPMRDGYPHGGQERSIPACSSPTARIGRGRLPDRSRRPAWRRRSHPVSRSVTVRVAKRTFPIRSTSWSGRHWVGAATKVSRRPMAALSLHPCRDEPRQPARGLRRWLWRFWGRLCRRLPQLGIVVRWHRAARSRARAGAGARDVRAGASPAGDGRIPRRDCSSGSSAEARWLRVGQQELRVH